MAAERDKSLPVYLGSAEVPELLEKMTSRYGEKLGLTGDEEFHSLGPIVGAHAGPGSVAVAFFKKK